ncbi:hypothetical protein O6H91_23G067000 [Diphasiastrum complanatum]|uniref:Uncharacterized protein n=1 Tax=Diphasiastrum complanatum TaxID=34168 RepID=A0ACC2ABP0_DIPCM|nr:hypothetical protein O6H91_23G067000 [Diphasiastrum complanatum]
MICPLEKEYGCHVILKATSGCVFGFVCLGAEVAVEAGSTTSAEPGGRSSEGARSPVSSRLFLALVAISSLAARPTQACMHLEGRHIRNTLLCGQRPFQPGKLAMSHGNYIRCHVADLKLNP